MSSVTSPIATLCALVCVPAGLLLIFAARRRWWRDRPRIRRAIGATVSSLAAVLLAGGAATAVYAQLTYTHGVTVDVVAMHPAYRSDGETYTRVVSASGAVYRVAIGPQSPDLQPLRAYHCAVRTLPGGAQQLESCSYLHRYDPAPAAPRTYPVVQLRPATGPAGATLRLRPS